jgi:hypothetical protein
MLTLLSQMSDDQMALLGCGGALLAAFTVMAVSYHLGRLVRGESGRSGPVHRAEVRSQVNPTVAATGTAQRRAA